MTDVILILVIVAFFAAAALLIGVIDGMITGGGEMDDAPDEDETELGSPR